MAEVLRTPFIPVAHVLGLLRKRHDKHDQLLGTSSGIFAFTTKALLHLQLVLATALLSLGLLSKNARFSRRIFITAVMFLLLPVGFRLPFSFFAE